MNEFLHLYLSVLDIYILVEYAPGDQCELNFPI